MTGAEHYEAAERLLEEAGPTRVDYLIAEAQVHATLALAAATLDAAFVATDGVDRQSIGEDRLGWGYGS